MTTIPGAEYAPLLKQTLNADGLTVTVERRLDVSDPDDQRAIWRQAALRLGATEEEAAVARIDCGLTGSWWLYTTASFHRTGAAYPPSMTGMASSELRLLSRAHATAALCRAVWGPR